MLAIGDVRTVSAVFTVAGTPTDPTLTTLRVRKPGAAVVTYTYPTDVIIVRDSAGTFHANLPLDTVGIWWFAWTGTGAAPAAEESGFVVEPLEVAA